MTQTVPTSVLESIDADGLEALASSAKADPSTGRKTLKAVTTCEGGFRNLTQIRTLEPVLVSEPCHLLGDDAAPNPSEMALAALGSCISVGLLANATQRGVTLSKIEIAMEGDIDISAVWGVGDTPEGKVLGFTAVRCSVTLAGDADDEVLGEIKDSAMTWSPVVNTFANNVEISSTLTIG
ncbi:OsmC family protein [Streptomyces sp. AK010]|uniref:OsmC family protein n=1 Tax=Streptomyces sp. AK010 TaxID=2723074 RepID=UPI001621C74F|nr:OsmC family protein [Streptomyces sp. AK010]MBB6420414.1 putative OsmC-like protein [Streptomyces sp. AK010]